MFNWGKKTAFHKIASNFKLFIKTVPVGLRSPSYHNIQQTTRSCRTTKNVKMRKDQ